MATLTGEPNQLLQGGNPYYEIPTPNQQSGMLIFAWLILILLSLWKVCMKF